MIRLILLFVFLLGAVLTVGLGLSSGQLSQLSDIWNNPAITESAIIWSFTFFCLLLTAYILSTQSRLIYRILYAVAFISTLALAMLDSDPAPSLFFNLHDAGNAFAMLIYTALFFGLYSLVHFAEQQIVKLVKLVRRRRAAEADHLFI